MLAYWLIFITRKLHQWCCFQWSFCCLKNIFFYCYCIFIAWIASPHAAVWSHTFWALWRRHYRHQLDENWADQQFPTPQTVSNPSQTSPPTDPSYFPSAIPSNSSPFHILPSSYPTTDSPNAPSLKTSHTHSHTEARLIWFLSTKVCEWSFVVRKLFVRRGVAFGSGRGIAIWDGLRVSWGNGRCWFGWRRCAGGLRRGSFGREGGEWGCGKGS